MNKKEVKQSLKQRIQQNHKTLKNDETQLQKSLDRIKQIPKAQQKRVLKALPKKMREFAEKNLF